METFEIFHQGDRIELEFPSKPGGWIRYRLKTTGSFRWSGFHGRWTNSNWVSKQVFASRLKTLLDALADPTFPMYGPFRPTLGNIEAKKFSKVVADYLDLDGDKKRKEYVLFEKQADIAPIIARRILEQKYGKDLLSVSVYAQNYIRSVRKLFSQGQILQPEFPAEFRNSLTHQERNRIQLAEIRIATKADRFGYPDISSSLSRSSWREADQEIAELASQNDEVFYYVRWENNYVITGALKTDSGIQELPGLSHHLRSYYLRLALSAPDALITGEQVNTARYILRGYQFDHQNPDPDPQDLPPTDPPETGAEPDRAPPHTPKLSTTELAKLLMRFHIHLVKEFPDYDINRDGGGKERLVDWLNRNHPEHKEEVQRLAWLLGEYQRQEQKDKAAEQKPKSPDRDKASQDPGSSTDIIPAAKTKPETAMASEVARSGTKAPKSAFELNQEIEDLIAQKDKDQAKYSDADLAFIARYSGAGGKASKGAQGRGLLYEYYTPEPLVAQIWQLVQDFGFPLGGTVLEPAAGTGNFFKYATPGSQLTAFETNPVSARICELLYPHARVFNQAFESRFFAGNVHLRDDFGSDRYDLVIGNPPFGAFSGRHAGMGEKKYTGASRYQEYFILRGLDLLKAGGLLAYILPTGFLQSPPSKIKEKIAARCQRLLDGYRLPGGVFSGTPFETDLLILKRKSP